jgi:hypothetical protein
MSTLARMHTTTTTTIITNTTTTVTSTTTIKAIYENKSVNALSLSSFHSK